MAFKNKIAANCKTCGTLVAVGTGWTEGPPWVTTCTPCSGKREDAAPKVKVTLEAKRGVVFKLGGFLGGDLFAKYRNAIEGAKFDGIDRANYATLDTALKILPALAKAGFAVDLDPAVGAAVQAKTAQLKMELEGASIRAVKADEELQKRGLALFPFQKQGVAWLAARDAALLADDMGLGKTIQTLISLPEGAPVIVIGPAVAKGVWQRETAKWRPDLRVTVLEGKGSFRFPEKGEMVVLTYNVLSLPENGAPLQGTVIVADEAHLLKNRNSKRGAAFREISRQVRAGNGKVWLLTATPLMNRPPELWSLFDAAGLAQVAFGSWGNFTNLFQGTQDDWGGWHWGTPLPEAAERIRRVSLRRMKTEVLDQLPPKTYREIKVDLDSKAKKALAKAEQLLANYTRFSRLNDEPSPSETLTKLREEEQAALREVFGDAVGDIEEATRLVQQVGKAGFEELSRARAALATAKIPAMMEVVEDFEAQEEPLVVFSDHRAPIDFLKGREGWAVITGDTSADDRARIQDEFQAGKLKGVAATIKAGGVAITLTRASNALFVDLNWTPALNSQAEDRVFRIGQSRGVVITTLVADHPVDKRLFELLASKRHIVKHSVDASRVQEFAAPVVIAEFDLDAVTRAAEEERRRDEEAQAAAEARRKEFESKQAEIQKQNEEEAKKRRERTKREMREERWTREATTEVPRFLARTAREQWTTSSLQMLAANDPDRAAVKNDIGFSASDGSIGHKYAYLCRTVGLTEQQWGLAYTLCCKYHRQVGKFEG